MTVGSGGVTVDTQAFNISIGEAFSPTSGSTGGLTKIGSGNLTLSGFSSYTGATVVNAGELILNNSGGQGVVEGPLTINSGATVFANTDGIGYTAGFAVPTLTVNSGGTFTLTGGNEGYITNLNMAGGTVSSTNNGYFLFSPGYNISSSASTTTGTISSYVYIADTGPLGITVAAGSTPSGIDLAMTNVISGQTGGLGNAASSLVIGGGGTVLLSGSNTYAGGTTVTSGRVIAGNSLAFGKINRNVPVNFYNGTTLALGSLSAPAPAVSFPLVYFNFGGGGTGTANLQLEPTALYSSGNVGYIEIDSGTTLALTVGATPAAGVTTGLLTVSGGLILDDSGSSTLDIGKVSLDLPGASLQTVYSEIASAYKGGAWSGPGITSSSAASNPSHLTAVGVIANDNGSGTPLYGTNGVIASTFEGGTPAQGDILVKYTYYGDANLDGTVNSADYIRIDGAFLNNQNTSNTALTGWANGDFNYDGVINGSDYTLIDNAFNTQGAQLSSEIASPTALVAGSSISAVPEPASLGLLGISVLGLLARRRGHH